MKYNIIHIIHVIISIFITVRCFCISSYCIGYSNRNVIINKTSKTTNNKKFKSTNDNKSSNAKSYRNSNTNKDIKSYISASTEKKQNKPANKRDNQTHSQQNNIKNNINAQNINNQANNINTEAAPQRSNTNTETKDIRASHNVQTSKRNKLTRENKWCSVSGKIVNARYGPGKNYQELFQYAQHTPLFIIARYEDWYLVVDANGDRSWIRCNLVNDKRHIICKEDAVLLSNMSNTAEQVAIISKDTILTLKKIHDKYCYVTIMHNKTQYSGYIDKNIVFGVTDINCNDIHNAAENNNTSNDVNKDQNITNTLNLVLQQS